MTPHFFNVVALFALLPLAIAHPGGSQGGSRLFSRQSASGGNAVGGSGGSGGSGGNSFGANGGVAVIGRSANGSNGGPNGQLDANGAAVQGTLGTATGTGVSQIVVQVNANGTLTFDPSDIQVSNSSVIGFAFSQNVSASVTESSFDNPCSPLAGGFDSGLTANGTSFSVFVKNMNIPVYFFSKASGDCGAGMVGSINAPTSGNQTNAAFVAAAKAIGSNEQPVPDSGPQTGGNGGAFAFAGPTAGTPTPSSIFVSATSNGTQSTASAKSTASCPAPRKNDATRNSSYIMLALAFLVPLLPFALSAC
ncbi:uncharacterized protein PHACADRAFT_173866 [Phanerochaete carnosa HHB-10118-sp]|uniref:Uncharacterized protein n=1 Tax=Phanerochaete carnosa (strain HHB-10118-sp) TaxID=650164 RepID=K5W926_PHACS|nr:uncharacterized protein PHACADRAFT_173866 [Phanerochaete carnosa HHB-10118-sp]EKM55710.1 hypothetical protein PHACADRAFT_173866 [Phanerochaete carnosa HHB-10118-sp]